MTAQHMYIQESLFALPAIAPSVPVAIKVRAPLPVGAGYYGVDPRAEQRTEIMAETMGWSPESARDAGGVTANQQAEAMAGARANAPLTGERRTQRIEAVRQYLAALGMPASDPSRRGRRW